MPIKWIYKVNTKIEPFSFALLLVVIYQQLQSTVNLMMRNIKTEKVSKPSEDLPLPGYSSVI